jgi:hypothetical protein
LTIGIARIRCYVELIFKLNDRFAFHN